MNNQRAIQTVSHNISNKDTEGYSRQRVEVESSPASGGKIRIGGGAHTSNIRRLNNQHVEKQLQKAMASASNFKEKSEIMGQVENVFNEQLNKGLNKHMSEFFNSFGELAQNPESLAVRMQVKDAADSLTQGFKRINKELGEIQKSTDYSMHMHVNEINGMTKEIAELNERIVNVEVGSPVANDERDRRDLLIKKLGEIVDIDHMENKQGAVTITTGGTAVLVSGFSQQELFAATTQAKEGKPEGGVEIFYKASKSGSPVNITQQIKGGKLGAEIQLRDGNISQIKDRVNEMAYNVAWEVNRAHVEGFDRYNKTGEQFFKISKDVKTAASTIALNENIKADVGKIAVAAAPGSPGDNRIANIIANLESKQTMSSKTSSYNDFYASIVGEVGIDTARAKSSLESSEDSLAQVKNMRETISGVSLDEEATKLIEYQKAYAASARLIKTADEMLDTVLRIKPM